MKWSLFFSLAFMLVFMVGCASKKIKPENVHVEVVQKSSISIDTARTKLLAHECHFKKNIEAPIAPGTGAEETRLLIGLRNKTAEEGGNAVISSLLPYSDGKKTYAKGMIYSCPEDHSTEHVQLNFSPNQFANGSDS